MNTGSPIKGLMIYSFHSASGNLTIIFLVCLVMAAGLLITGNGQIYFWLGVLAINAPVYIIIAGMAAKTGVMWKRFQLAMPVKRSDLVSLQYIQVIFASIVGVPLFLVCAGIVSALHEGYPDFTVAEAFIQISPFFSMSLLMAGLFFPLACLKISENRQEAFSIACFLVSVIIVMPLVGTKSGIPRDIAALLVFAISSVAFIISFVITNRLYSLYVNL